MTRQLGGAAFVLKKVSQFDGINYKMIREDGKLLVRTWPSRATMLNPLWWVTSAFSFALRWVMSRPYLPMLLALPGVVTALALVGAISAGNSITTGTYGIVYKRLLTESIRTKDIPTARLAIDALLQLEPSNDTLLYDSALIEADAGNVESARQIMMELATSAGSGPAALWMARETARNYANTSGGLNMAQWTPEQCTEYYRWLTVAVSNAPEDPLPRRMISELFRLQGKTQRAYDELLPIADVDTDTSYDVCLIEQKLGLKDLAMARGEKLIRVYKSELAEKPDDVVARARYAMLLAVTERLDEGTKLLMEGLELETDRENVLRLRKTMVDMMELATSAGSGPAALWMAGETARKNGGLNIAQWTPKQCTEYYRWLTIAVNNAPEDPLPRRLIGELFLLRGDKKHAYQALLPIADVDTDTSFDVCLIEQKLGLKELAMARGEKLLHVYKPLVAEKPEDVVSRTRYAMLLAVTEREGEGTKLLEEGLTLASNPEDVLQLRKTMADILVMESERLSKTNTTPRGLIERYRKLIDAVAVDPTNSTLIDAITRACIEAAESKNNELFILREALVQNVDPDTAHFILGTIALNRGDTDEATQHLEIAAKKNPNLPGLLNKLAYAISHSPSPDLPRALRMSDAALATLPDHPYLHETRGQIHLKLKNYTAAIADLEVALNAPELRPQVREGLAQAYEASGQAEIAQRQRDMLKAGK